MPPFALKLAVVLLIFLGEACAIAAEMWGARMYALSSPPLLQLFLKMMIVMTVGGSLLILGYTLGFRVFQNIWIVSATSITSILIIEPILAYTLFQQAPTTGALIGLLFGLGGFLSTMFL